MFSSAGMDRDATRDALARFSTVPLRTPGQMVPRPPGSSSDHSEPVRLRRIKGNAAFARADNGRKRMDNPDHLSMEAEQQIIERRTVEEVEKLDERVFTEISVDYELESARLSVNCPSRLSVGSIGVGRLSRTSFERVTIKRISLSEVRRDTFESSCRNSLNMRFSSARQSQRSSFVDGGGKEDDSILLGADSEAVVACTSSLLRNVHSFGGLHRISNPEGPYRKSLGKGDDPCGNDIDIEPILFDILAEHDSTRPENSLKDLEADDNVSVANSLEDIDLALFKVDTVSDVEVPFCEEVIRELWP